VLGVALVAPLLDLTYQRGDGVCYRAPAGVCRIGISIPQVAQNRQSLAGGKVVNKPAHYPRRPRANLLLPLNDPTCGDTL
jgi:hypothetical protein